MAEDKTRDAPWNQPVLEVEFMGCRAVVTGGKWSQHKQAVYTQHQLDSSTAVPPPAATPVVEENLEVHLTILWSPGKNVHDLLNDLLAAGVPLEVD